jgi:hypothetical protein
MGDAHVGAVERPAGTGDEVEAVGGAERETFGAARRAGADLLISYGARSTTAE